MPEPVDESQSIGIRLGIPPNAPDRFGGFWQQFQSLVVANRLNVNADGCGKAGDGIDGWHGLTLYHGTGLILALEASDAKPVVEETAAVSEKTRVIGTTGAALGLGAFAAAVGACCALPWAVALMGVGGAVALARLSFLLPYALVGAGALLAAAFWWAYRPHVVCPGGSCNPASRRTLRWIVWGATVLVVGLATASLTSE